MSFWKPGSDKDANKDARKESSSVQKCVAADDVKQELKLSKGILAMKVYFFE